jgi:hypothetical protein
MAQSEMALAAGKCLYPPVAFLTQHARSTHVQPDTKAYTTIQQQTAKYGSCIRGGHWQLLLIPALPLLHIT